VRGSIEVLRWKKVLLFHRLAFDGVDYLPELMFNQSKWNDALYQKN
jgi:hypothetical protein